MTEESNLEARLSERDTLAEAGHIAGGAELFKHLPLFIVDKISEQCP